MPILNKVYFQQRLNPYHLQNIDICGSVFMYNISTPSISLHHCISVNFCCSVFMHNISTPSISLYHCIPVNICCSVFMHHVLNPSIVLHYSIPVNMVNRTKEKYIDINIELTFSKHRICLKHVVICNNYCCT